MPRLFGKWIAAGLVAATCLGSLVVAQAGDTVGVARLGKRKDAPVVRGQSSPIVMTPGASFDGSLPPGAFVDPTQVTPVACSTCDGGMGCGNGASPCFNAHPSTGCGCNQSGCNSCSPKLSCRAIAGRRGSFCHRGSCDGDYGMYGDCPGNQCRGRNRHWLSGDAYDCDHTAFKQRLHDYLRCKFGYFIPSGNGGVGAPPFGCYARVYPQDPYYNDARDTGSPAYAAQGYGVPVSVPLAPVVGHTYNYSAGIPASRLTPVSRIAP